MSAFSRGAVLVFFAFLVVQTYGANRSAVIKRLLSQPDLKFRPNIDDKGAGPVRIEVNFYGRDFFILDDSIRHIGAQLTFRQKWNDPRLSYPETELRYLSISDPSAIWRPDTFFSSSRKGRFHDMMEPNLLFRIYPNGDVLYSRRVSLDLQCKSDWTMFPLNKVVCPVTLASYGFTTNDAVFFWKEGDPVQMSRSLNLPQYSISLRSNDHCDSRTNTGEYSCLKSVFVVERHYGGVLAMLYVPPLNVALLAWLSFFLDRRRSKVRLSFLLALLVLAVLTCFNATWQKPYRLTVTASDVWCGLCLAFVIYALVHFLLVNHMPCVARICGYDQEKNPRNHVEMEPMIGDTPEKDDGNKKVGNNLQKTSARLRHLLTKTGNRADIAARMLYPSAFIIVNIIYWAIYQDRGGF